MKTHLISDQMENKTMCALTNESKCEIQCFTCMDDDRCDKANTAIVRVTPIDTGQPFDAVVIDEVANYYIVTPIGTEKTQAWNKSVCKVLTNKPKTK